MVYLKTPINPTFKVSDIAVISAIHKKKGTKLVVDGTFYSAYFRTSLEFGVDILLNSITKYMNGHIDVEGGIKLQKYWRL